MQHDSLGCANASGGAVQIGHANFDDRKQNAYALSAVQSGTMISIHKINHLTGESDSEHDRRATNHRGGPLELGGNAVFLSFFCIAGVTPSPRYQFSGEGS